MSTLNFSVLAAMFAVLMTVTVVGFLRSRAADLERYTRAERAERRILAAIQEPRAPARQSHPFVFVLVFAEGPHGPTTMGLARELDRAEEILELHANLPLKNVQVIVFCDVRAVAVEGIYCGIDLVHANIGECPVAKFQDWPPGVRMRLAVRRRTPPKATFGGSWSTSNSVVHHDDSP
jgi:hypothetical protein